MSQISAIYRRLVAAGQTELAAQLARVVTAAEPRFDRTLTPATTKQLRSDFMTLMKGLKRVDNYQAALDWTENVQDWRSKLTSYMEAAVRAVDRLDDMPPVTIRSWQSDLRDALWPLLSALGSTGLHTGDDDEERAYRAFSRQAPKFEQRVKKLAREAWKRLDGVLKAMNEEGVGELEIV